MVGTSTKRVNNGISGTTDHQPNELWQAPALQVPGVRTDIQRLLLAHGKEDMRQVCGGEGVRLSNGESTVGNNNNRVA